MVDNSKLYRLSGSDIRVKLNKNEQRRIFKEFIKNFKNKTVAAGSIKISKYSLYDYENCRTTYIPKIVLDNVSKITKIEYKSLNEKTLKEIRRAYIQIATKKFIEKYRGNWKMLTSKSRRALFKKYGKNAYSIICGRGHKSMEARYGKDWRKILSKMGIAELKRKYGKDWYDVILKRGRERLRCKYGKHWQSKLSEMGKDVLRKRYGNNFRRDMGYANINNLLKNREPTRSEKLIRTYLKKNKIQFETNVMRGNLEFDIAIPDGSNPKFVIEISDAKPTTYNQRMRMLKLYYQKLVFPNAQHIAILRCSSLNGNRLHSITKSFLDKKKIILASLENIKQTLPKIIKQIKKNSNLKVREEFVFHKRGKINSFGGCVAQSKRDNGDELRLNKLLSNINASIEGDRIINLNNECFMCVDGLENYKGKKIAYEITSSNSINSLRSLAGKIILCKSFNDIYFITVLNNPKILNNVQLKLLNEVSDIVILKKDFNEENLIMAREKIMS